MLVCVAGLALLAPGAAQPSNATLKTAIAKWSHTIALDARAVSISASRRHPRRMMLRARTFRADALRARRAIKAQRATTTRGRRAKGLAAAAFADYSVVGAQWALSGQARLQGKKTLAARHASIARSYVRQGNNLIRSAGHLLG